LAINQITVGLKTGYVDIRYNRINTKKIVFIQSNMSCKKEFFSSQKKISSFCDAISWNSVSYFL